MSYQVVARRFRPQIFAEVVGQEGVTETLIQGLASGRIAHAWLFAGPRGVGKTTTARILARALNCEAGPTPEPCGVCPVCLDFLAGKDPDVEEIDGASHRRIEDIRELRDRVAYKPMRGSFKVFIIDEVHMLTREAFNALLKTLEEPPAHVVFILATTESHKVPETIRSRCQCLTFRRIGEKEIATRLGQICQAEKAAVAPEVLDEIAGVVRGGMRDAESLLERVLTLSQAASGSVTLADLQSLLGRVGHDRALAVAGRVLAGDLPGLLADVEGVVSAGLDEGELLGEVVDALREVLLLKVGGFETQLLDATGEQRERVLALAGEVEVPALMAMLRAGLEGRARMRRMEEKRLVLELTLLQMAQGRDLMGLGAILEALRTPSGELEPAAPPRVAPPPPPVVRPAPVKAAEAPAPAAPPAAPSGAEALRSALGHAFPVLQGRLGKAQFLVEEGRIEVRVPGLGLMESNHFGRPETKGRLAELAEKACGRPVQVSLVALEEAGGESPRAPKRSRGESSRVKAVRETFAAEVVEVEQKPLFPEEPEPAQDPGEEEAES